MVATPAWTAVSKRKTLPLSGSSARSKSPDLAAEGTAVLPHRGAGTCQLVGSQDRAAGGDAGDPDPAPAEQQKTGPSFRKGPVFYSKLCGVSTITTVRLPVRSSGIHAQAFFACSRSSLICACAAARRAIGTRNGLQET